jgi:hypothetical protein
MIARARQTPGFADFGSLDFRNGSTTDVNWSRLHVGFGQQRTHAVQQIWKNSTGNTNPQID